MTFPEISERAWHLAHTAKFLRDAIRELEKTANENGYLPADLAGLMAHLSRVATAIENRRAGDSPELDGETPAVVETECPNNGRKEGSE
jgi:hypothetical protein